MKTTRPISKLLALVLCLSMISALLISHVSATEPEGTPIYDEAGLKAIADNLSGDYYLANNIKLTENWSPIDNFTGTLDGDGHSIYNMNIVGSNTSEDYFGLFGVVNGATIKNLTLYGTINVTPVGSTWALVGSFAGRSYDSVNNTNTATIQNCVSYVDINVNGRAHVGGIIGQVIKAGLEIKNCANYGAVSLDSNAYVAYVGGIISQNNTGVLTVENCVNFGDVTMGENVSAGKAHTYLGGIFAWHAAGTTTLKSSVNFGSIESHSQRTGGVVGYIANNGTINIFNCANIGDLEIKWKGDPATLGAFMGGIVGHNEATNAAVTGCYNDATITHPYAAGTSNLYCGGIAASEGKIAYTNCVTVGSLPVFGYGNHATSKEGCEVLTTESDLNDVLDKLNNNLEEGQEAFRLNNGAIEPLYYLTKSDMTVIGYQMKTDADNYSVRFVSAVSSLGFDQVGYRITVTGTGVNKSTDVASDIVYSAIYETKDGQPAQVDSPYGCYFYTATIEGISVENYDELTFVVTPYVIPEGGTVEDAELGSPATFVFKDGVLVDCQK